MKRLWSPLCSSTLGMLLVLFVSFCGFLTWRQNRHAYNPQHLMAMKFIVLMGAYATPEEESISERKF